MVAKLAFNYCNGNFHYCHNSSNECAVTVAHYTVQSVQNNSDYSIMSKHMHLRYIKNNVFMCYKIEDNHFQLKHVDDGIWNNLI